jgi:uncharacterized membrane protein
MPKETIFLGGESMKSITNFLFAILLILLALDGSAQAYRPVIDLGTLSGYNYLGVALSINDNGQIVGYVVKSPGDSRACLFDSTGGGANINLGALGGGFDSSAAYSINNSGQIVGNASYPGYYSRACLFDSTGGGANKEIDPGGNRSVAVSINDSGQIVGSGGNCAVLFYPTGGGVYLADPLGWTSGASSINNSGQIVGSYAAHACLFDPTGGWDNIDLGGGGALSINNIGQIVGYEGSYACLFDSTGGGANINLGTLGGGWSFARSINDIGQIVGDAQDSSANAYACLFDPTGQGNNIDLNTLIDPSSGWTLKTAYGINNNGWIVGEGMNPTGYNCAFLITPEPASVLLFGLGGLALLRKRRA